MIIFARCGNGYCGCESEEVFFFDDSIPEQDITEEVSIWAYENAESYSYVHFGWDEYYTEEEYEDYLNNYVDFDWHVASYEEYVAWCENWGYTPKTEKEIIECLSM